LQKDLGRPAGLEVLTHQLQADHPLRGRRVGRQEIRGEKGVPFKHCGHPFPHCRTPADVVTGLKSIPGAIDVGFPLFILGKDAHHRVLGYLAHVGVHLKMLPVQEPPQGKGAESGYSFPHQLSQFPVGRASNEVPQDLMRHLVPHDQGQFIIIETESYQPLGQDDFPRRRIGINFAVLGFYQDGEFGRQALGVEDKGEFFSLSVDQEFHRPGKVPFLGLHADMFQVEQDGGQEFSGPDGHPKSPTCGHFKIPH